MTFNCFRCGILGVFSSEGSEHYYGYFSEVVGRRARTSIRKVSAMQTFGGGGVHMRSNIQPWYYIIASDSDPGALICGIQTSNPISERRVQDCRLQRLAICVVEGKENRSDGSQCGLSM